MIYSVLHVENLCTVNALRLFLNYFYFSLNRMYFSCLWILNFIYVVSIKSDTVLRVEHWLLTFSSIVVELLNICLKYCITNTMQATKITCRNLYWLRYKLTKQLLDIDKRKWDQIPPHKISAEKESSIWAHKICLYNVFERNAKEKKRHNKSPSAWYA